MTESYEDELNGVAIIGMSGRFPDAANITELWQNLCDGRDSITFFKEAELDPAIPERLRKNQNYVRARGVLQDADKFDADFFGFSRREAEITDPQLRIFLELAWTALEDAGYTSELFDGLIGVYAGKGHSSYYLNNILTRPDIIDAVGKLPIKLANQKDYLATQTSYKLDLKGPSVNVNTACSSSLVAVCQAFDCLLSFQCDMALAGGVSVIFPQNSGHLYQEGATSSKDGYCKPFDAGASGSVTGCGAGVVVLKRLDEAIEAGDHIYGVIRGIGLNNDGADKVSFAALSVGGQAQAVALAQASSDTDPETITYIEAHGTATPIGDAIEVEALNKAFRLKTAKTGFCRIGSIKSNFGSLDAAAGVAGLIKTALCLENKKIPPSLHFKAPNPGIDFETSPFVVNSEMYDWSSASSPRRAGVSAFGVGGTNAHVIVEEAPVLEPSGPSRPMQLFLLSAKTEFALDEAAKHLRDYLIEHPQVQIADAAYTLVKGRKAFQCRRMVVAPDCAGLIHLLGDERSSDALSGLVETENPPLAFFFPDMVPSINMGRSLFQQEGVFRIHVKQCADILTPLIKEDLLTILYPEDCGPGRELEVIAKPLGQPALFAIEYALAKLWESWGASPQAVCGNGAGEYVAACCSGILTLEDALILACIRGRLLQEIDKDKLLAAGESAAELKNLLEADLSVKLRTIRPSAAKIPCLSGITGTWISPEDTLDPNFWLRNLLEPEHPTEGIETLCRNGNYLTLVCGTQPYSDLMTPPDTRENSGKNVIVSLGATPDDEWRALLTALGQLWLNGVDIRWDAYFENETRYRLPLPTYPFRRTRYWLETAAKESPAVTENMKMVTDMASRTEKKAPENCSETPLSATQRLLIQIFQGLFGVDQIEITDDFFSLGGDSLLAVQLFSKINEHTGINLPLTTLIETSVLDDLAGIVEKNMKVETTAADADQSSKENPVDFESVSDKTTEEQPASESADRTENSGFWPSIVAIQPAGSRPPFFCFHAEGGNVLHYSGLTMYFDPDQPLYGLKAQGLNGLTVPYASIEDMARHYIAEMREVQPTGPYYLGGAAMGGLIALETAQQLKRAGESIALLAMFETYNPNLIKNSAKKVNNYSDLLLLNQINTFIENFMTSPTEPLPHRLRYWYIEQKNGEAIEKYKVNRYAGKITLFRAQKKAGRDAVDPLYGWGNVAQDGVEMVEIQSPRDNILEERMFGERLNEMIDKVQKDDSNEISGWI